MKRGFLFIILLVVAFTAYYLFGDNISTNKTSATEYNEFSRKYCPDSSKFLLNYAGEQEGADDKTSFTCVLNRGDDINEVKDIKKISFADINIDSIYWENNNTIILIEKYAEIKREGKTAFKDSVFLVSGITVKVLDKDPINKSFSRKIIYRETSPDKKQDVVVYRYVKPADQYYFLNVSVINKNDSIPEYGNFFIAKYDNDCISDIRWDNSNQLTIKAPSECYYSFKEYLVKHRPNIDYNLKLDADNKGNIKE